MTDSGVNSFSDAKKPDKTDLQQQIVSKRIKTLTLTSNDNYLVQKVNEFWAFIQH